ncbi:MAG TPA: DUF6569 family protein, partial [Kofleriaceae bacterium]|nr:DUF6569 family protein [Kofleriaceae bacterium]
PIAVFAQKPEKKPVTAPDKGIALDKQSVVLAPLKHANLAVFPVMSTADKPKNIDYLVLDEGMKKKLVVVVEKGESGDVNQLELRNMSDRPLFLMAGEVVIGGKQDRIIGKNTIVAPKTTEQVPVFCVEHGRWSGRKAEFSSAQALAHTELRKKASFSDQSEVWKEVSAKNAKRNLSNQTDTYRGVAQDSSVKKSIDSYDKAIRPALASVAGKEKMIGFVVALDGRVVAIETFASPSLFRKFQDKLLRSYFVEAVDHKFDPAKPPAAPAATAITGFAEKARKAKRSVVLDKKSGKTVQFDEAGVKGSAVEAEDGDAVYQGAYE